MANNSINRLQMNQEEIHNFEAQSIQNERDAVRFHGEKKWFLLDR